MADDAEIRRENFKRLWDDFSPSVAARALWGTTSQWSDLYHGRKSFGEKLARQIEERLNLVRLSLDDPEGAKRSPLSRELMRRLEVATDDERSTVEALARAFLKMPPAVGESGKQTKQLGARTA